MGKEQHILYDDSVLCERCRIGTLVQGSNTETYEIKIKVTHVHSGNGANFRAKCGFLFADFCFCYIRKKWGNIKNTIMHETLIQTKFAFFFVLLLQKESI